VALGSRRRSRRLCRSGILTVLVVVITIAAATTTTVG
jgi:hypothetical protein